MYRPPSSPLDDLEAFADWVELCVLWSEEGQVSQAQVADVLRDEGLIGVGSADLFSGDITYVDANSFSEEDGGEQFSQELWQVLSDRRTLLGSLYPFSISDANFSRRAGWMEVVSYSTLLLADACRTYALGSIAYPPFPRLFEKLVEASEKGLARGKTVRFGVPKDAGWPVGIENRIRYLGELLGLEVEDLEGKTNSDDGDRGLDVASRLSFGDEDSGTVMFLTQCATGENWVSKTGEPSIRDWQDILKWNAVLVRVLAVPWHLRSQGRTREFRKFDAVILDRFRLLAGNPDLFMAQEIRDALVSWCESISGKLPGLYL